MKKHTHIIKSPDGLKTSVLTRVDRYVEFINIRNKAPKTNIHYSIAGFIKWLNKSVYACPFCKMEMDNSNKTEINYKGKWYKGCHDCYMKSIEDVEKFNK